MEENKNTNEVKQPTYEELAQSHIALRNEYFKVFNRLTELENSNALARLNFLFEVLKANTMFPKEFVDNCTHEIMDMMTIEPNKEDIKEE